MVNGAKLEYRGEEGGVAIASKLPVEDSAKEVDTKTLDGIL